MSYALSSHMRAGACYCVSVLYCSVSVAQSPRIDLFLGVPEYPVPGSVAASKASVIEGFPPAVRITGGAPNPPPTTTSAGSFEDVSRILFATAASTGLPVNTSGPSYTISGELPGQQRAGFCLSGGYTRFAAGSIPPVRTMRFIAQASYSDCPSVGSLATESWSFADTVTTLLSERRKAIDGSEYEALPIAIKREQLPWITYYAGYRMGVVSGRSNWIAPAVLPMSFQSRPVPPNTTSTTWSLFPSSQFDFDLVRLPPPFVEGEVVEYQYTSEEFGPFLRPASNYFFYTASETEQRILEQSDAWTRTGYTFKHGGYLSVCRSYGGSPVRLHRYSIDGIGCDPAQAGQAVSNEGAAFRASKPLASAGSTVTCPAGAVPLYNATDRSTGMTRYSTSLQLIIQFANETRWEVRDVAMCTPK